MICWKIVGFSFPFLPGVFTRKESLGPAKLANTQSVCSLSSGHTWGLREAASIPAARTTWASEDVLRSHPSHGPALASRAINKCELCSLPSSFGPKYDSGLGWVLRLRAFGCWRKWEDSRVVWGPLQTGEAADCIMGEEVLLFLLFKMQSASLIGSSLNHLLALFRGGLKCQHGEGSSGNAEEEPSKCKDYLLKPNTALELLRCNASSSALVTLAINSHRCFQFLCVLGFYVFILHRVS